MTVRQVGGDHYEQEYQHWDWVDDLALGYLKGYATKYVFRHEDKKGREDLLKTVSCLEKLKESGELRRAIPKTELLLILTERLDMSDDKSLLFVHVAAATNPDMVDSAIRLVERMIEDHYDDSETRNMRTHVENTTHGYMANSESGLSLEGLVFTIDGAGLTKIMKDGESMTVGPDHRLPKMITMDQYRAFGYSEYAGMKVMDLYEWHSSGTYMMIRKYVRDHGQTD